MPRFFQLLLRLKQKILDHLPLNPIVKEIKTQVLGSQVIKFLIYELTLPLMSFSIYEERLFNTNLTDYLFAEKFAKNEPLLRVKSSGYDLVDVVLRNNNNEYLTFIKFVETSFKSQPTNPRLQHGLLFILENFEAQNFLLTTPLNIFNEEDFNEFQEKNRVTKDEFEIHFKAMVLEGIIFQGLASPEAFIRSKTCSLIGQLDREIYVNENQAINLCRMVCEALQEENEVTRITAIKALEYLVGQTECLPILKSSLNSIIDRILEMLKLANIDDVVKSLYEIVRQYNDEILGSAIKISNSVLSSFYECFDALTPDEIDFEGENDTSKDTLEISILTLNEILLLNLPQEFYINSSGWVFDLVGKIMMMPHLKALVDPAFKLLNSILFNLKELGEREWSFLPLVVYVMLEQSPKVEGEMLRSLTPEMAGLLTQVDYSALNVDIPDHNRFLGIFGMYFQHSKGDMIRRCDVSGTPYLQLVFMCLEKLKAQGVEEPDGFQLIVLTKILIFVIENSYAEVKSIAGVRESMFDHMLFVLGLKDRSEALKVNALQCMCIWLYVDAVDFIQLASGKNFLNNGFYLLFGALELFESSSQREDLLYGISGLFGLPSNLFPEVLPVSSLIREGYTSVKVICNHKIQQLEGNGTDSAISSKGIHPQQANNQGLREDEECLYEEDDEDDDEWNEETLFEEEIMYEYESPLTKQDPVIAFRNVLISMEQNESGRFQEIISQLSPSERNELIKMYGFAEEYQKNKANK